MRLNEIKLRVRRLGIVLYFDTRAKKTQKEEREDEIKPRPTKPMAKRRLLDQQHPSLQKKKRTIHFINSQLI